MAAGAEKLAPIYAVMGPHLYAPPAMQNVAFDPSGLKALLEGTICRWLRLRVSRLVLWGGKWDQLWRV